MATEAKLEQKLWETVDKLRGNIATADTNN